MVLMWIIVVSGLMAAAALAWVAVVLSVVGKFLLAGAGAAVLAGHALAWLLVRTVRRSAPVAPFLEHGTVRALFRLAGIWCAVCCAAGAAMLAAGIALMAG